MSSSAPSPNRSASRRVVLQEPAPVIGVRFTNERVYFALEDGREVGAPLAWFPRLQGATVEQRACWEYNGTDRLGLHWPDVDEDIHVAHLFGLSD